MPAEGQGSLACPVLGWGEELMLTLQTSIFRLPSEYIPLLRGTGITPGTSPSATTSTACPAAMMGQSQGCRWDWVAEPISGHCHAAGCWMPTRSRSALQDRAAIHKSSARPSETCHSHRNPVQLVPRGICWQLVPRIHQRVPCSCRQSSAGCP